MFWRKMSTISVWSGGTLAIVHIFLKKYVEQYVPIFYYGEIGTLSSFLFAEAMKLILKMNKKNK